MMNKYAMDAYAWIEYLERSSESGLIIKHFKNVIFV